MGYGEYGGGGSIAWKVDVDDESKPGKKRAFAYGRDAKVAQEFTVSLDYPNANDAANDLNRLKTGAMRVQGTKIVFEVNVQQQNEGQVGIEW
jgi:hypothetical protein